MATGNNTGTNKQLHEFINTKYGYETDRSKQKVKEWDLENKNRKGKTTVKNAKL